MKDIETPYEDEVNMYEITGTQWQQQQQHRPKKKKRLPKEMNSVDLFCCCCFVSSFWKFVHQSMCIMRCAKWYYCYAVCMCVCVWTMNNPSDWYWLWSNQEFMQFQRNDMCRHFIANSTWQFINSFAVTTPTATNIRTKILKYVWRI